MTLSDVLRMQERIFAADLQQLSTTRFPRSAAPAPAPKAHSATALHNYRRLPRSAAPAPGSGDLIRRPEKAGARFCCKPQHMVEGVEPRKPYKSSGLEAPSPKYIIKVRVWKPPGPKNLIKVRVWRPPDPKYLIKVRVWRPQAPKTL